MLVFLVRDNSICTFQKTDLVVFSPFKEKFKGNYSITEPCLTLSIQNGELHSNRENKLNAKPYGEGL